MVQAVDKWFWLFGYVVLLKTVIPLRTKEQSHFKLKTTLNVLLYGL